MNFFTNLETFRKTANFQNRPPSAVTLGNFDALHLGHRELIQKTVEVAQARQLLSAVLTYDLSAHEPDDFSGHETIKPSQTGKKPQVLPAFKKVYTWEERQTILAKIGVDVMLRLPFTAALKTTPAAEFLQDILVGAMHAKYILIGYDHRFGQNRQGDFSFLEKHAIEHGYETARIEPVHYKNTIISSTVVRDSVSRGKMEEANAMLGEPFFACGVVTEGKKLGSQLGFATANLVFPGDKLLPANGVYAGYAQHMKKTYRAVVNIGNNPTFENHPYSVEAHLLDFQREIYGHELTLRFLTKLRDEIKFENTDQLTAQVKKDIQTAAGLPL